MSRAWWGPRGLGGPRSQERLDHVADRLQALGLPSAVAGTRVAACRSGLRASHDSQALR
jgi:hypothetical protein